jgi:hypothetical protein
MGTIKTFTTTGDWPFPPEPLYWELVNETIFKRDNAGNSGEKWVQAYYENKGPIGSVVGFDGSTPPRRWFVDITKRNCEEFNLEHGK